MERGVELAREDQAWADLASAVAVVPAERVDAVGVVPGWSTHDVVWHVAYWAGYGAEAIERIRQGKSEPADEEASEADNEAIAQAGRTMTWDEVMSRLVQHRLAAREALDAFDGVVPERALEFFSDCTTEHYREHEAHVRAFVATSLGQLDEVP